MVITTKAVKRQYKVWNSAKLEAESRQKNYTSGMIQTWNKFCFTGGILELSIDLPGKAGSGGMLVSIYLAVCISLTLRYRVMACGMVDG